MIPDMVLLRSADSLSSLEEKGVFIDIYDFLDTDPALSRDDILKCLRTPLEKNGSLYKLATKFYILDFAGKTSNIGHLKDNWTFDTMLDYAVSLPEGQSLFDISTRSWMLKTFMTAGMSEFVNPETNECSFDNETFKKVLEYIKPFPDKVESSSGYTEEWYAKYRDDSSILLSTSFSTFNDYLRMQSVFAEEDITVLGYPGAASGLVAPSESYAISAWSAPEVQDGAWQFLKKLVLDTSKYDGGFGDALEWGATYKSLEVAAEKDKNLAYTYYSSGGYDVSMFRQEGNGKETEMQIMRSVDVKGTGQKLRLTDENISFMKEHLENVTAPEALDNQIMKIINEEAGPFFTGSKTIDETVKIIQSRVSIYLSESN